MAEKHKIFIGLTDVASFISDMKTCFKSLGVETITALNESSASIHKGNVDYIFSTYNKIWFGGVRPRKLQKWLQEQQHIEYKIYRKAMSECDAFIFIWNSFKKDYSDYKELKKRGKKIITIFMGSDIRWHAAADQEFENFGLTPLVYATEGNLHRKISFLRTAEKYSDFTFNAVNQSQLSLRPYYRYDMQVVPSEISYNSQRKKNVVIAHAPSRRFGKGTDRVIEVFENLKKEGIEFTPMLIENVPNTKALEMYAEADIIISELRCPGIGKLTAEGLACGKVVLSIMEYDKYPSNLPPLPCPVVDVNMNTLYEKLKELIADVNRRNSIASQGREYALKYLNMNNFCGEIVNLLDGKIPEYTFYPTFFRNQFIPESEETLKIYNQWTQTVKDCDWYKKYVAPGERNGLIF